MKRYILMLLCAAIITGCGKDSEKKEETLRPVRFMVASNEKTTINRSFAGIVEADIDSLMSFRVSGTIEKKYVKYGDRVKKGDILAKLDPTNYQIKYQSSIAEYKKAQSIYSRNKADFQRIQSLYFNDNVSKADYDTSLAMYESSQAELEAALKKMEFDKTQLGYTYLTALSDGIVAEELKDENETIKPGNPVYRVSMDENLDVEFFVPESLISEISKGETVNVVVDSEKNLEFKGQIIQVGDVSTGFGRTFPVKVRILNANNEIKTGMTAEVVVKFESERKVNDGIVIPMESVKEDVNGNKYIFKVKRSGEGTGVVEKVEVETKEITSNSIKVIDGVNEGDLILTRGISKVYSGKKVLLNSNEKR